MTTIELDQARTAPPVAAARPCWICGDPADSGEHKPKKSDLRDVFGAVSQSKPLIFNNATSKNRRVQGLNSDLMKWRRMLCQRCNSTLTQPHDKAWEAMSAGLRSWTPKLAPGSVVRANRIFPADTASAMLDVHRYFAKVFGCLVVEADDSSLRIDLAGVAHSIKGGPAHPDLYLAFGIPSKITRGVVVSASDLHILKDNLEGGAAALATWFYNVNGVCALVAYAPSPAGVVWARKEALWHPRHGTNRFVFKDFRDEPTDHLSGSAP